jgi:HNH endonuclease
MNKALERKVWRRARGYCEYCFMAQKFDDPPFEIDHILTKKHGGQTAASNLALSCFWCNSFKGPNIGGWDRKTRKLTPLFHPRRHSWARHFRWQGAYLLSRSAIGRVTIAVLKINDPLRVALRQSLIDEGLFPPNLHGQ